MKQSTVLLLAAGGLGVYLMTRQGGVVALPAAPVTPAPPAIPTITMPESKMPEIVINIPQGQATGAGGLDMASYLAQLQAMMAQLLRSRSQPGPTGGSYTAPPGTPMGAPPPGAPVNPPSEGNPWGIPPGDVWSYPSQNARTPVSSRAAGKAANTQTAINQLQEELARLSEQVTSSWQRTNGGTAHQLAPPSLQDNLTKFTEAVKGMYPSALPQGSPGLGGALAPLKVKLSQVLPGLGGALGPFQDAAQRLTGAAEGLRPGKRGLEMPFTGWEMPFTGWEAPKVWDPGWWLGAPEFKIPSFLR